jgi:hypothetical protein
LEAHKVVGHIQFFNYGTILVYSPGVRHTRRTYSMRLSSDACLTLKVTDTASFLSRSKYSNVCRGHDIHIWTTHLPKEKVWTQKCTNAPSSLASAIRFRGKVSFPRVAVLLFTVADDEDITIFFTHSLFFLHND